MKTAINGFMILTLMLLPHFTIGQEDSLKKMNPLNEDAYLHPVDCITPYTLKKGEWIYAQSIQTLPFPSWAFVGITDKITAQVDLLPWIYGSFSELKKPIPSLNVRYRFNEQKGAVPTFGVEAMFVHFWDTLQRFTTPTLTVWENGSYFHLKPSASYKFENNIYLNASIGIDYIGELILQNNDSTNFQQKTFSKSWNPNFSFGIDYRPSKWISYHAGYTYGSTLTFLENVPRKHQLTYGVRIAPFYKNRWGILRCFRVELLGINGFFPDIRAQQVFPIPVFPYFYWQWHRKDKKSK
ncbi:MAG: YjbH domain-containing protein [bacterium]|nr:YjbH domain-containing protein [bacterium]